MTHLISTPCPPKNPLTQPFLPYPNFPTSSHPQSLHPDSMAQRQHQHILIRAGHLNYIITIPPNPFPTFPIPDTPKILELPNLRPEVPFNITLNSGLNIKFFPVFLIHIQKSKKKILPCNSSLG